MKLYLEKYGYYIVIICVAIFTIGANPFYETNAPMDLLVNNPGWSRIVDQEVEIENEARSDVVDAILPGRKRQKELIQNHGLSWKTIYLTGYPLKLLFKPDIMISYLFSGSFGFYLTTFLRLGISGIGMFVFLNLFFKSRLASLFGAITFMLSGFQAAWIYWPHVGVSIWFPWLLWSVTLVYRSPCPIMYGVFTSLFSAFAIYAWFPSVAAYVFYSVGIWTVLYPLLDRSVNQRILRITIIGIGIGVAILIAAFLLFEQKEILFDTYKVVADRVNYGGSTLEVKDLRLLMDPQAWGEPFPEISLFSGRIAFILVALFLLLSIRSILNDKKVRVLFIFSVLLILISSLIGWELLPENLVKMIPTFSFNPWHRITILLCFGIAVVSSSIINSWNFDRLEPINRYIMQVVIILLICLQTFDLRANYRDINSVNDQSFWYPNTPTLDYLQKEVGDGQKIMADNSFFVPGTLRYYNLEDWFSHGFKTRLFREYLAKLVRDPHVTNTAASYTFGDINNLGTPFFDILCIKYIVSAFTNDVLTFYPQFWQGESIAINLKNSRNVTLSFIPEDSLVVQSIGAILGTYFDDYYVDEQFSVNVSTEGWDTTFQFTSRIYNNETHLFQLPRKIRLHSGVKYLLTLTYHGNKDLAIWAKDRQHPKLAFNVQKDLSSSGWKRVNQEDHVILLENMDVPNGIYSVDDIHQVDRDPDIAGLTLERLRPHDYRFTVEGPMDQPKWVVLAIKDKLHYKLKSSGQEEVQSMRYQGVFPAFKISQPGTYYLRNRPPLKGWSWLLSLTGIGILGFCYLWRKPLELRLMVVN